MKLWGKPSGQSEEQRDELRCLKENEQGEPTRERDGLWAALQAWLGVSPMGAREAPALLGTGAHGRRRGVTPLLGFRALQTQKEGQGVPGRGNKRGRGPRPEFIDFKVSWRGVPRKPEEWGRREDGDVGEANLQVSGCHTCVWGRMGIRWVRPGTPLKILRCAGRPPRPHKG